MFKIVRFRVVSFSRLVFPFVVSFRFLNKSISTIKMKTSDLKTNKRKKEIQVLVQVLSGVEPNTFRLLVRMLYHWATGDLWELRPLN